MINESNEIEQVFKCKFDSNIYLIKLQLIKKQINIIINATSELNKDYLEYTNNYTLSHLQEINNYFKIFNNIKEIYKDLLKLIQNKNFRIIQNEDETLSFIINIKINYINKKIKLSLIQTKIKNNNNIYTQDLNYELKALKNRLITLEESQGRQTYQYNNYNLNKFINSNNNILYDTMENMLSKMNQLETEANGKTQRIKLLEQKLNFYQNNFKEYKKNVYSKNPNYEKFINKKNKSVGTDINNNYNYNNINPIYLVRSYNDNPYKYSIYSDNFNYTNRNRRNNIKNNISIYKSVEKDRNNNKNSKINEYLYNNNYNNHRYKLRYNQSYDRNMGNMGSNNSKKYNNIPIVKRENILNLNSRIIFTNKEIQLLLKRLSYGEKRNKVKLKLLYRASKDGDCEEIIKMKCENKFKKLTLFYTMEGSRFGVYTEHYMEKSFREGYVITETPGSSFIISLNNLIYYNVMAKQNSLNEKYSNRLCFGLCSRKNNNETNWLIYTSRNNFLGKKYLFGNKNDVYLNLDFKKIVGNNPYYHIKDVEIFQVIIDKM